MIVFYLVEYHLNILSAPVLCDLGYDKEFCQNRNPESQKK
jgi:hypothetical protein